MYQLISSLLIIGTVITLFVMSFKKLVSGRQVAALGFVGLTGGLLIPNLTVVSKFQMSTSGAIIEAQRDVTVKAEEVQQLAQKTQELASAVENTQKQVMSTSGEVKAAEQNVRAIENELRETCKALLVTSTFTVEHARTIYGIPKHTYDDIEKHFDILASFAYPDETQRRLAMEHLKRTMPGGSDYGK
jgi:peptidoglycan hydrolase CwlO-like protein